MIDRKLTGFVILIVSLTTAPALAGPRHKARVYNWLNTENLYAHNFGPGRWPDSLAFYDGPTRALCKQGAAAYRGQDGRRHPCL